MLWQISKYHARKGPNRILIDAVDRGWFTPEAMAKAAEGGHAVSGD